MGHRIRLLWTQKNKRNVQNSQRDYRQEFQGWYLLRISNEIGALSQETPWLSETDVYGIDTLSQFLIILDEMHIGFDFDEVDADLSAPPPLNRFVTSHYFEFSKRCDLTRNEDYWVSSDQPVARDLTSSIPLKQWAWKWTTISKLSRYLCSSIFING